jgi:hypothetical protein
MSTLPSGALLSACHFAVRTRDTTVSEVAPIPADGVFTTMLSGEMLA